MGQTVPSITPEFIVWFVMTDWIDKEISDEFSPEYYLKFDKDQNDFDEALSGVKKGKVSKKYLCYYQANKFLKHYLPWIRHNAKLHLIDGNSLKGLLWGLAVLVLQIKRTEEFELLLHSTIKRSSIVANVFKFYKDSALIARLVSQVTHHQTECAPFKKLSVSIRISRGMVLEASRSSQPFHEFSSNDLLFISIPESLESFSVTANDIRTASLSHLYEIKFLLQQSINEYYEAKGRDCPVLTNTLVALFFVSILIEHSLDPFKIALVPICGKLM